VYFSCVYGHILIFVFFCPMVHYWSEYLYYANLLAISCCHLSLHSFSNLHVPQYRWNTAEVYIKHKCTLYNIMGYNLLVTCVRTGFSPGTSLNTLTLIHKHQLIYHIRLASKYMSRWNFRSFWIISFYHEIACGLEKVADTKGMIRSRKSKDKQFNGQKKKNNKKQWSTKHYSEN
jgi:hypothetical protein